MLVHIYICKFIYWMCEPQLEEMLASCRAACAAVCRQRTPEASRELSGPLLGDSGDFARVSLAIGSAGLQVA